MTETWLTDFIFNQELLPHNFIIQCNCKTRGGVLIATKNNIPALLISKHDHIEFISLQFGFCQGHTTNHQLLLFLNKVHQSLNHNATYDIIYLDFHKAFNSVPHNELLMKLCKIGITGNWQFWI